MGSIDNQKEKLRQRALTTRLNFAPAQVNRSSRMVSSQLQSQLDWSSIGSLHCYLPIQRQNEIDTWQFLAWLWAEHPSVKTFAPYGDRLDVAVQVISNTPTGEGKYGIPVPIGGRVLTEDINLDVIIVPCLMVSSSTRHRIGYGQGNYDRFLSGHKSVAIGLCYKQLAQPDLPHSKLDVPLDMIILG
jgi:5-formyltetrahydrofolate cyclo-ligase